MAGDTALANYTLTTVVTMTGGMLVDWCVQELKCIQSSANQRTLILLARFAPFLLSVDETCAIFDRHSTGH